MKKDKALNIVDIYLSAISTGDVDMIMSLYAQDCVVEDPVGGEVQKGYDAVKEFYTKIKDVKMLAKRTGDVRVPNAANVIAFAFQIDVDLGGSILEQDIIDVFTCDEDDKIVRMQAFWGSENARM